MLINSIRDLCINMNNHQNAIFHQITNFLKTPLALLGVDLKNFQFNKICHFANHPYLCKGLYQRFWVSNCDISIAFAINEKLQLYHYCIATVILSFLTPTLTVPPFTNLPKSNSSASGLRISFSIKRDIGRAPILAS